MKVLFFEDREEDIQGIVDYCVDQGYKYCHDKFVEGYSKIEYYKMFQVLKQIFPLSGNIMVKSVDYFLNLSA